MNVLVRFIYGLADPPCTKCCRDRMTRFQLRAGVAIGVVAGLGALWIWSALASMLGAGWLYDFAETLKSAALPSWLNVLMTLVSFALAFRSARATAYWYFLRRAEHELPSVRCKCALGKSAPS
uniref:Membrane protein n=1 Tax=Magnetospirillum gryphiswaldense TaxID=55518 RepID=A4U2F7_9PROT|nr:membrane protein [Magnetospirillum gryphiswaldense MSR-1]